MNTENSVLIILFYTGIAHLTNTHYIFLSNPQIYLWWQRRMQLNSWRQHYRFHQHSFYHFCNEVARVKIKSQQTTFKHAAIDTKIRAQCRYASRYNGRY